MFIAVIFLIISNFNWWMDKWTVAHCYNWILFRNKKEHATYTTNNTDESHMHYAKL